MSRYWHYCYKIYHPQSNTTYIGKHSTDDLGDGYRGSGFRLVNIPIDEMIFEILSFHDTEDAAYDMESLLVTRETVKSPFVLNVIPGGRRGITQQTYDQRVANGKKSWEMNKHDPKGFHKATKEQVREWASMAGKIAGALAVDRKTGIHAMTTEERSLLGKINYNMGYGLGGISHDERVEIGTRVGKSNWEAGIGLVAMSEEDRLDACSRGGKTGGKKTGATYGKLLGQRSKARLSKPLMIDGIKYDSLKDAHINTGISLMYIRRRCESSDWPNYNFLSKEVSSS